MTSRKAGLTAEQHQALGAELAAIRDRLVTLYVEVANAYPKNADPARPLDSAVKRIDKVRSNLEDRHAREHPAEFSLDTYWPVRR